MIVDTAITIAGIVFVILALSLSFAEKDKNDGQARLKRSQEHRKEKRMPQMKRRSQMIEGTLLDRLPDLPKKEKREHEHPDGIFEPGHGKKREHEHPDGIFEPGHGEKRVHEHPDGTKETAHYSGYRESLKTLYKSGLVTRQEYRELMEKHKKDL